MLSLGIGRLVRAHARLEYGLRNVHHALDATDSALSVSSGFLGADRLSNECVGLLRRADLGDALYESGEHALRAAQEASSARNGIVHDLWLIESAGAEGGGARWNAFGAVRGSSKTVTRSVLGTIRAVDDARVTLERATVRISGLFMALHAILPRYAAMKRGSGQISGLHSYIALMNDQFHLEPNGDWEVIPPT